MVLQWVIAGGREIAKLEHMSLVASASFSPTPHHAVAR